jgi:hypothetical protein
MGILAAFFVLLMIYGCNPNTPLTPKISETTTQPTNTHEAQGFPDIYIIPTQLIRTITPTASKQETKVVPSQTQAARPSRSCLSNGKPISSLEDLGIYGTIFYTHLQPDHQRNVFAVEGNPVTTTQLPVTLGRSGEVIGLTREGDWLAYLRDKSTFGLLSHLGEIIEQGFNLNDFKEQVPGNATILGWGNHEWVNDKLIYLGIAYRTPDQEMSYDWLPTVLDPFEAQWKKELITTLGDALDTSEIAFSSDMTRVFYVNKEINYVIMDLETNRIIWEKSDISDPNIFRTGVWTRGTPEVDWSPDNYHVAYTARESQCIKKAGRPDWSICC